jgi:hypothetical protein
MLGDMAARNESLGYPAGSVALMDAEFGRAFALGEMREYSYPSENTCTGSPETCCCTTYHYSINVCCG